MTENEQIKEIAMVLCGMESGCDRCMFNPENCHERKDAEALYSKSYRKVSEVAREIFEEIEENYADYLFDGSRNIIVITEKDFAELKKKYTEGEK